MKKSKHLPRDPIWVCTVQTHSAWSCPLNHIIHYLLLFVIIFGNDCMIISIENVCITFSWHTKTWCLVFNFLKIFHLPTFNFHGKEEKMLSVLFQKPILSRQLNWLHCVSSLLLPQAGQAKHWFTSSDSGGLFSALMLRKRWNIQQYLSADISL